MLQTIRRIGMGALALAVFAFALLALTGGASAAGPDTGYVFTLTNAASGNGVAMFQRAEDGSLTAAGVLPTGGLGTGSGLGSQGAVVLSGNHQWLLAVNAGSNDISAISLKTGTVTSRVASGGTMPISVTINHGLVYVVNAGSNNISGFRLDTQGMLWPISGSTVALHGVAPAQIQFSPNGQVLAVTEKGTNTIDLFTVGDDGVAQGPQTYASSGPTPFGFGFRRNTLVVSEAFGGAGSAVSSYRITDDGGLTVVSPSVAAPNQKAACWLIVTRNGRYAYTTNAGTGTITGYAIAQDGSLTLLRADAVNATVGGHPIDMALSINSHYLYALNNATMRIDAFQVQSDGSLVPLTGMTGMVDSVSGLAAY